MSLWRRLFLFRFCWGFFKLDTGVAFLEVGYGLFGDFCHSVDLGCRHQ